MVLGLGAGLAFAAGVAVGLVLPWLARVVAALRRDRESLYVKVWTRERRADECRRADDNDWR